MVRVEAKSLVRFLTPTATQALEAGVARAVNNRHREVGVEHMLLAMLEQDDGDCGLIMSHVSRNRARLVEQLECVVQGFKADNQGKPVFSESLFLWFEDTWLLASLEHGASRIRTGALFYQFIRMTARYCAEEFKELQELGIETLGKDLRSVVAAGTETSESVPSEGATGGQATSKPGSDGTALEKFTVSLTDSAAAGKIDPIFARHREIRQVADVLTRRRKNNPIIVGEPGVGKTALVEGLALAIAKGEVPEKLLEVDLRSLDIGMLQAGAGMRGEFENRLKAVISDVKSSLRPVVLFIDEAHTIIGAGGGAGSSDAANLLKPELARGELRTIAATTWSEYKKYFEKDAALARRFQPVKVDEPSVEDAIGMLRGLAPTYEASHGLMIRDEAVVAAVTLSHRYVSGRQLPDKAVDLLDTAAARVGIELATKPEQMSDLEAELAALERAQAALQREVDGILVDPDDEEHVEATDKVASRLLAIRDQLSSLNESWKLEHAAVEKLVAARKAISSNGSAADADASANKDADGVLVDREATHALIRQAIAEVEEVRGEQPLIHAEVDADVVAQVVGGWTGIPVGKMKAAATEAVLNLEDRLRERVRGQEDGIRVIAETIRMAHAGIRNPTTPVGVLLFVGPSGVGKTEIALTLADTLYGGERFMTTINMSEFQEKHAVSRLIGSPPGYVGYGEGGILTEAVRQRPHSVVLLDECEKADIEVMNLFYQVFDKGVLNDSEGRTIDFRNTIVVLTSNLATDEIMDAYSGDEPPPAEEVISKIRPALNKHFKPALVARMTVIPFRPLGTDVLQEIAELKLNSVARRLEASHRIQTEFSPELLEALARRCTDPETGARNVDAILRSSLLPAISRELLQLLADGVQPRKLTVGVSPSEEWRIEFSEA